MTLAARRAARATAAAGLSALAVLACSSGTPTTSPASSGSSGASGASTGIYGDPAGEARSVHVEPGTAEAGLPPRTATALRALYADRFAALGVRFTRGAVVELATGPHLQLYVEPPGPSTPADYVGRILPLARAVGPEAFATWPALATFDVCQEPPPGVDDSAEPPPETVLFMTRAQAEQVTWDTATLADLRKVIAASKGGELNVSERVGADPAWTSTAPS